MSAHCVQTTVLPTRRNSVKPELEEQRGRIVIPVMSIEFNHGSFAVPIKY